MVRRASPGTAVRFLRFLRAGRSLAVLPAAAAHGKLYFFFPPVCSFAHSQRSVDLQQRLGALSTGGEGFVIGFFLV